MDADTTDSFHVYTLEWTEKQMTFKFDGQTTFVTSIDKIMQGGTYNKNGQPFDKG